MRTAAAVVLSLALLVIIATAVELLCDWLLTREDRP